MNNNSIKQPADQPKLEHGSNRKEQPPKKRTSLLVALMVVTLLALGGVVYLILPKGNKSQIQNVPPHPEENTVTSVDNTDQGNLTVRPVYSTSHPVEEFRYILQPAVCCVLIVINIVITLLLVSKFKLTKKENPTKKLLKDLRNNMGKWNTKLNEIHIETNLIKNEGWNSVMFKLGSISEKIEALANEIRSDRDKIPGGR